jgi:hypothetical protein
MAGLVPRVSGLDLVDMLHGIDSTCFQAFGDVPGHEKRSIPCTIRIAFFTSF